MRSLILLVTAACTPLEPVDSDRGTDVDPGTERDTEGTDDPDTSDPDTDDPSCADDDREPDDTLDSAGEVALPASLSGAICRNDPDYVQVSTQRRCEVTADLTFPEEGGDLDLILYRDGFGVGSSIDGTSSEQIAWTADADGVWVVGVEGRTNAQNTYDLVITEDCGAVCADDAREPDNTQGEASALIDQVEVLGRACESNPDWFQVNASNGCRLNYVITPVISGTMEATLHGPGGPIAEAQDRGGQLVIDAILSGTHWLELTSTVDVNYGMNGSANQCNTSPVSCPFTDSFEPNDSRSTAPLLAWATRIGASSCGDEDWYRLPPGPTCSAIVEATFNHSVGDLDIELVNAAGQIITEGNSETSNERITTTLPAGDIYLRVFGFSGAQNGYTLNTALTCP